MILQRFNCLSLRPYRLSYTRQHLCYLLLLSQWGMIVTCWGKRNEEFRNLGAIYARLSSST